MLCYQAVPVPLSLRLPVPLQLWCPPLAGMSLPWQPADSSSICSHPSTAACLPACFPPRSAEAFPPPRPALANWSDALISCSAYSGEVIGTPRREGGEEGRAERRHFGWVTSPARWSTAWAMSNCCRTTRGCGAGRWRRRWALFSLFLICSTCCATWLSHGREAAQQPGPADSRGFTLLI